MHPVTAAASPGRRLARLLLLRLLVAALLVLVVHPPAEAAPPVPPATSDPVGVWPLDPVPDVVAGFDPPPTPWSSGHRGVDLAGRAGQVVRSALPGTVAFAGVIAGRPVVVVSHGATRTTYEPVAATVAVGDAVAAGAPIGRLVVAGSHCFPDACLHWGWIEGETYLDPLRLVGAVRVRLLPLWRDLPVSVRPWGGPAGRPVEVGPW